MYISLMELLPFNCMIDFLVPPPPKVLQLHDRPFGCVCVGGGGGGGNGGPQHLSQTPLEALESAVLLNGRRASGFASPSLCGMCRYEQDCNHFVLGPTRKSNFVLTSQTRDVVFTEILVAMFEFFRAKSIILV